MSFKISFIGAGSIGFTRKLLGDVLAVPEFKNIEISLMDVNKRNLEMVNQLVERDIKANGLTNISLTATTDRKSSLKNARYVFCTARIGGIDAFESDIEIPLKYNIDQCVGDTLSAGGVMYGQRGVPVILDICRDINEVAEPGCRLFNYANPMAMLTWAANQYGKVETIGLCHGVQGGHRQIAEVLGVPQDELNIIAAGINHQTWYIRLLYQGRDMTKGLLQAYEQHPQYSKTEKVRIDVLRRFGYFSTESNGHLSEYLAWYRKRPEELKEWISLDKWINGETGGYLRVTTEKRRWFEEDFPRWMEEDPMVFSAEQRSPEHGSYILEGLETGRVYRGHFNVKNKGVISNLPDDSIVEVPGFVDSNGINIPVVGDLPLGCAAICNASISVQRLAVSAAVDGDDLLLRQAMLMDPLVGAVASPPEVWQMVDELLVAQARWLPQYENAIKAAKKRLSSQKLLPTNDWSGAARLPVRTVAELRKEGQKV